MLLLEDVTTFCFEALQKCKRLHDGQNFTARCPFCNDSKKNPHKKRLHIEYISEEFCRFHCFNCNESGNFYKLYAHVKGCTEKEAFREFNKFDPNQLRKKFTQTLSKIVEQKEDNTKYLDWILDDCVPSSPTIAKETRVREAWKRWECTRKVSNTYVALRGKFANRIIIPIYESGHIVYFQGRALIDGMEPKYLNPVVEKAHIIMNKERFDPEKYIIVTEGILDAMTIEDHQGTTCLGASISDAWLTELYKYTRAGIIIALDNDETGIMQLKKLLKESKFASKLKYFIMPDKSIKDLNEFKMKKFSSGEIYTEPNNKTFFYDYVLRYSYDSFKCNMMLRLNPK